MKALLITSNLRQWHREGDAEIRQALTERKGIACAGGWFGKLMLDRDPSYMAEPAPSRMV